MYEVMIQYLKRGWRISYNTSGQALFKDPDGFRFFVLSNCSESEKNFIDYNKKEL